MNILIIDAHRRGGEGRGRDGGGTGEGRGRVNIVPPQANFKILVNKNAINPEIGGPPLVISPESLDPLGILAKKHQVPPLLDFQPLCIYDSNISSKLHVLNIYTLAFSHIIYDDDVVWLELKQARHFCLTFQVCQ